MVADADSKATARRCASDRRLDVNEELLISRMALIWIRPNGEKEIDEAPPHKWLQHFNAGWILNFVYSGRRTTVEKCMVQKINQLWTQHEKLHTWDSKWE